MKLPKAFIFVILLLHFRVSAQQLSRKKPADPAKADTSLIVYAPNGSPIKYAAYFSLLWKGEHYLETIKGRSYLKKYPDSILTYIHLYHNRLDSVSRLNNINYRLARADKVLVVKSMRRMYIQRGGKTLFEFPINLGKNPTGHKASINDGRTPEGQYSLDFKMWTAQYYKNFHISYPDSSDIAAAKKSKTMPGGDVMIHGTSAQRAGRKDWTNGCIALTNAQIDTLFKYVPIGTLIEIRK
jgi:lipoprotein-anchoring transpeptidase ErfK/SrfK